MLQNCSQSKPEIEYRRKLEHLIQSMIQFLIHIHPSLIQIQPLWRQIQPFMDIDTTFMDIDKFLTDTNIEKKLDKNFQNVNIFAFFIFSLFIYLLYSIFVYILK